MLIDLRSRLRSIADLPTLPDMITELNAALSDPDTDLNQIAAIIAKDPAVTANLLKLVNSAYFRRLGDEEPIVSVQTAAARVGLVEVRNLVFSLSLVTMFPGAWKTFDKRDFWRHCLAVALTSQAIWERSANSIAHPDDAANTYYVAGLLHDLGIIVMEHYFRPALVNAVARAEQDGIPLHDAEERMFGMCHGELGALLAEQWNLPPAVVAGMRSHHRPDFDDSAGALPYVLHVADHLCLQHGMGPAVLMGTETELLPSLEALGLDLPDYYRVFDTVENGIRRQDSIVEIAA